MSLQPLSEVRQAVLQAVKRAQPASVSEVSEACQLSYEAARQHLAHLAARGWLERRTAHQNVAGRPEGRYRLTLSGENLFSKSYDLLAITLIDAIAERYGLEAVEELLASITDAKVAKWAPLTTGRPLKEQLEALTAIYAESDPHTEVQEDADGLLLIERNCPFLAVALKRPALCSLTVSALTRLLGHRVRRESTFQAGDGCCRFRVDANEPIDQAAFRFAFEED